MKMLVFFFLDSTLVFLFYFQCLWDVDFSGIVFLAGGLERGRINLETGLWLAKPASTSPPTVCWLELAMMIPPTGGALNLLYVEALRSTSVEFRGSLSSRVTSPTRGATEGRNCLLKTTHTLLLCFHRWILNLPWSWINLNHSFLVFLFNLL